jgi:hypothetical protein
MSMPRTIRILTALTLAFGASVSDAQDQTTAYSQPEPGERVLSFYSKMPQHAIAITHSGHVGLGMFPPGIPRFTEPGIRRGLIANLKLADERGEVVGFAAELELFPESSPAEVEDVRWETGWALAIRASSSRCARAARTGSGTGTSRRPSARCRAGVAASSAGPASSPGSRARSSRSTA